MKWIFLSPIGFLNILKKPNKTTTDFYVMYGYVLVGRACRQKYQLKVANFVGRLQLTFCTKKIYLLEAGIISIRIWK